MASKYIDCELSLLSDYEASLTVVDRACSREPLAECLGSIKLREISHSALESYTPEEYGQRLFDAVLFGELLAAFHVALTLARREGKYLRFRLVLPSRRHKQLHKLNWELLYDRGLGEALGCSPTTPFSRYVAATTEPPWPIDDKPRLLVVTSSPSDVARYRLCPLDRSELQATLEKAVGSSSLELDFLEGAATRARIRERLIDGNYHGLHLHAHGVKSLSRRNPRLMLEKNDGSCDLVSAEDFSKICMGSRALRLTVLIACHSGEMPESDPLSGLGPRMVRGGVPAVVAMRRSISIGAAERFTRRFYQRLAATGTIDSAVNEARLDLSLDDRESREWATPALFMRLRDGQLWRRVEKGRAIIPELLPFTVNRGAQERGFFRAVERQRQQPDRPLCCLIVGDDRQALDMFEERSEKEFLPSALDSRSGISSHRLDFSPETERREETWERFRKDLSEEFLNHPDGSIDDINRAFGGVNRPILIHSHLVEDECRKPDGLLCDFLDFWATWPDLVRGQRLVVLLFVEYEHAPSVGKDLLSRIRTQRQKLRLKKFEQTFVDYEAGRRADLTVETLPRLENIRRGAVDDWACDVELRKYCKKNVLLREVKSLFRDWKSKMSSTAIPMEDLAKNLEAILIQNQEVERST